MTTTTHCPPPHHHTATTCLCTHLPLLANPPCLQHLGAGHCLLANHFFAACLSFSPTLTQHCSSLSLVLWSVHHTATTCLCALTSSSSLTLPAIVSLSDCLWFSVFFCSLLANHFFIWEFAACLSFSPTLTQHFSYPSLV